MSDSPHFQKVCVTIRNIRDSEQCVCILHDGLFLRSPFWLDVVCIPLAFLLCKIQSQLYLWPKALWPTMNCSAQISIWQDDNYTDIIQFRSIN